MAHTLKIRILLMGIVPNAWADDLEWLLDITQKATHISDQGI